MPARRLLTLLLSVLVLALAACGGSDGDDGNGGSSSAETEATPEPTVEQTETGCRKVEAPEPKGEQSLEAPTERLDPATAYVATVTTNCGEFAITLSVKKAPKTTSSFAALARDGFFDGTTFHRIVPGFVIQGGDPLGNGQGGPGYSVEEAPPKNLQYTRGVVAMAKTGAEPAGTSGSQFFVVTGEDTGLPADYALLGRISGGEEVVDAIATTATDPATEAPVDPVVIESIEISER